MAMGTGILTISSSWAKSSRIFCCRRAIGAVLFHTFSTMSYVKRFINYWSQYYSGFNATNLSGASDVVVVARKGHTAEDLPKKSAHGGEELRCSQFHVRFGKMGLFRPKKHKVILKHGHCCI